MSSTYLKFLSRNKLYTFIELFGLSAALGFVILLASYARTEFNVGASRRCSDDIYAVGAGGFIGMTLGTADEFFPSIPEIREYTILVDENKSNVMSGNDWYSASEASVDTNFFKMFPYRLEGCSSECVLENADEVILAESFAKKVFGNENPLGRTIIDNGNRMTVVGLVEDFGVEDVFQHFDLFTSLHVAENRFDRMDNFGQVMPLVRLDAGADVEKVRQDLLGKFKGYWQFYQEEKTANAFLWGASLTRMDEIYFSDLECYGAFRKGDRRRVEILFFVALLLLVSAMFNYINLTVAQTGKRAREMATRRLLGEKSSSVTWRYIAESFVFTSACFVIGCLLAYLCRPFFEDVLDAEVVLAPDFMSVCIALLVLVLLSVISAAVPAVIVSGFQPASVVKGDFRFKSKMVFSKVFIVLQCVFSTVLTAVAITMTAQIDYLTNLPTGYDADNVLQVKASAQIGFSRDVQEALHERLKSLPQVADAGLCVMTPEKCGANGLHDENKQMAGWLRMPQMDTASLRILGIHVNEKFSELASPKVLLTESSARSLGLKADHPYIGGSVSPGEYEVCGTVPDFMVNDALFEPMENEHPAIMIIDGNYKYAAIQLLKIRGDRNEALGAVRNVCREFAKETTGVPSEMEMSYLDDELAGALKETRNTMLLVMSFMFIAILISSLGLFAMALYFTEQKSRQIAVRKVFGADTGSAVRTMSKSFMMMTAVAVVIAVPLACKCMAYYLEGFHNRIQFPWWALVLAALCTFLISFISVIGQTFSVATRNPVETLSKE